MLLFGKAQQMSMERWQASHFQPWGTYRFEVIHTQRQKRLLSFPQRVKSVRACCSSSPFQTPSDPTNCRNSSHVPRPDRALPRFIIFHLWKHTAETPTITFCQDQQHRKIHIKIEKFHLYGEKELAGLRGECQIWLNLYVFCINNPWSHRHE